MKTYRLSFRCLCQLWVAAILICLPNFLLGADKTMVSPATVADAKPSGYDLEIVEGQLVRPGGRAEATLANVVDALRERYTDANIVLAPGLAKLKIADVKLRAGRLAEELEAVRVASGEKFEFEGPSGPNPPMDPKTGLPLAGAINLDRGLFVLRESRPSPDRQRVVEAFNIGPYLEWLRQQSKETGQSSDAAEATDRGLTEVMTIVRDTVSKLKGDSNDLDQPVEQYHPGATLLVFIGTRDSLEVARKIINALPGMSSVAEESRAQYGLDPRQGPTMSKETRAAQEAFRKRYGLTGPAPEPSPPK